MNVHIKSNLVNVDKELLSLISSNADSSEVWQPRLYLYNSRRELIGKEWGEMSVQLAPGVYSIRSRFAGKSTHKTFSVKDTENKVSVVLGHDSSSLIVPYGHTPSLVLSNVLSTLSATQRNVCITYRQTNSDKLPSFELMTSDKQRLSPTFISEDSFGPNWVTLIYQNVTSNLFVSNSNDLVPLQIPLGFSTWLFFPVSTESNELDVSAVKLFYLSYSMNIEFSSVERLYEMALMELTSGEAIISKKHRNLLLRDKFREPMFGIAMLAIYLQSPLERTELFHQVWENTYKMLPNSDDVIAIQVIAIQKWKLFTHISLDPILPQLHKLQPMLKVIRNLLLEYFPEQFSDLVKETPISTTSPFVTYKVEVDDSEEVDFKEDESALELLVNPYRKNYELGDENIYEQEHLYTVIDDSIADQIHNEIMHLTNKSN